MRTFEHPMSTRNRARGGLRARVPAECRRPVQVAEQPTWARILSAAATILCTAIAAAVLAFAWEAAARR